MLSSKPKRIIFVAVLVAATLCLGFLYRTHITEPNHDNLDVALESNISPVSLGENDLQMIQEVEANQPGSSVEEEINSKKMTLERQFHSARTGEEAQRIIEELYSNGFDKTAAEMEGRLAAFCPSVSLSGNYSSKSWAGGWVGDELKKYCASVKMSDDEFADTIANFAETLDQEIAELKNQFNGLDSTDRNSLLRDKITHASSWRELELLKLILRSGSQPGEPGDWVYDLGQSAEFKGEQGRDVQVAALQLYQCETLGSFCGSNSLATLNQCAISGLCQPGWSMRDFYDNTLSLIELEQVDMILSYLRSLGG